MAKNDTITIRTNTETKELMRRQLSKKYFGLDLTKYIEMVFAREIASTKPLFKQG